MRRDWYSHMRRIKQDHLISIARDAKPEVAKLPGCPPKRCKNSRKSMPRAPGFNRSRAYTRGKREEDIRNKFILCYLKMTDDRSKPQRFNIFSLETTINFKKDKNLIAFLHTHRVYKSLEWSTTTTRKTRFKSTRSYSRRQQRSARVS